MERQSLAMAAVPVQSWGERFSDAEAMQTGTLFKELYKPFFAAEGRPEQLKCPGKEGENTEREILLQKITQTAFVLDDLTLYLDTHEQDQQALALYREKSEEKGKLMRQFAEQFYPLCRCCMSGCQRGEGTFCWQMGKPPWEGACGHVAL